MGVSNPTLLLNICPIKSRCISCLFWVIYAGNWGSSTCLFMCIRSIIVIITSVICAYTIIRTSLLLCSLASPARLRAILSRRNSVIYTVEKQPVRLLLSGWVRLLGVLVGYCDYLIHCGCWGRELYYFPTGAIGDGV